MSEDKNQVIHGMLLKVAKALGPELLENMAFLGGCATGLHVTDDATKNDIRMTDDVDLVVNVVGYVGWAKLQEELRTKGFRETMDAAYTCSMRLDELQVDFLPDDAQALGFTCKWYKAGLRDAIVYYLGDGISIKLLSAPYFIATKIDAYHGRGGNDLLASKDTDDIFSVIDGREELIAEVRRADLELQKYIAVNLQKLSQHNDYAYKLQDASNGDKGREGVIRERIDELVKVLR